MTDTPLLEARNVSRISSDGSRLLDRTSLIVHPGDRWGITGPTGAGKSLLLRAISLLDSIDGGQILWQGHAIANADVPAFRRKVVYLHQRPVLLEGSVEDNLKWPETLRACSGFRFERERVVQQLIKLGQEPAFLAKPSRELSGGEGQLVALLRAVQVDPGVLLLDEPTASLDAHSTDAFEAFVGRWISEPNKQRATVWVSHDTEQLQRIANRTLVVENGTAANEEPVIDPKAES